MNDLEKRAHDLAVILAAKLVKIDSDDQKVDLNEYADNYIQIYEEVLHYLSIVIRPL